ncbi:MAG: hypothetical protein HGA45_25190 [Chloroflexales bacterium]|nr:hypothetical protein [Chloroflexales bacterium]
MDNIVGTTQQRRSRSRTRSITKALGITIGILGALVALGWVGVQIQPAPFPAVAPAATPPETIALPADLPAPVARYYQATYGDAIPMIRSAVISGRGTMRLFGIPFPARFRFRHGEGRSFRAYFEPTIFGLPIMKVDEHFVDGRFRQEGTPGGVEGEPKEDHSAAIRLWAERVEWAPALLLSDPAVRWEPIDGATALLVVPVGQGQERLVVRFDPATDRVQYVEGMKYKHPSDTTKTLWINAVWFGEAPWIVLRTEDISTNVGGDTALTARGA